MWRVTQDFVDPLRALTELGDWLAFHRVNEISSARRIN
jgi:hypothetical protein